MKFEDTAVHNSVAAWVDSEAKEKCRPNTAYQKKHSEFLSLPFAKPEKETLPAITSLFYREHKTLPAYAEYSDALVCHAEFIRSCFSCLLEHK